MIRAEPHRSASIEERLFAESTGHYYVLPVIEDVTDVSDDLQPNKAGTCTVAAPYATYVHLLRLRMATSDTYSLRSTTRREYA